MITVGTWNIHKGKKLKQVMEEIEMTSLKDSDVLNLQEIMIKQGQGEEVAKRFGYQFVSKGSNAIFTRFPIIASGHVVVNPETGRSAVWADLSTHRGTIVRVYCPHLSYKVKVSPFIPEIRGQETRRILEHAADFNGSVIVAGDLNTVGFFVGGHEDEETIILLKNAGYKDTLERVATRTHQLVGRIDWIFAKGLQTLWAVKGEYTGSDHRWMQSMLTVQPAYH